MTTVERLIKQFHEGDKYGGYIKIAGVQFNFTLSLDIPIPDLGEKGPLKDIHEVRDRFSLTIAKNGGNDIYLTDQEHGFFFSIIMDSVVEFYLHPLVRCFNKGIFGLLNKDSFQLGLSSPGSYHFTAKAFEMLGDPKFGVAEEQPQPVAVKAKREIIITL